MSVLRDREKEVLVKLRQSQSPEVELFKEYLRLRASRQVDRMLSQGGEMPRGAANELRDIVKQLDKDL
jgi:hypothetical protein